MKITWTEHLKEQNIDGKITDFKIVSGVDEGNKKTYYLLVAIEKDDKVSSATEIYLDGNYFVVPYDTITITCTGCSNGCDLGKNNNVYYCTAGCYNNCKKSVSRTFTKLYESIPQ